MNEGRVGSWRSVAGNGFRVFVVLSCIALASILGIRVARELLNLVHPSEQESPTVSARTPKRPGPASTAHASEPPPRPAILDDHMQDKRGSEIAASAPHQVVGTARWVRSLTAQWRKPPSWLRDLVWILFLILGSALIDWPPFVDIRYPLNFVHSLPVLLFFPIGYLVLTRTAAAFTAEPSPAAGPTLGSARPREFLGLLLGLCYGGAVWLGIVVDLILIPLLVPVCADPPEQPCIPAIAWNHVVWDYLGGHVYDLFAVAAMVGAVAYFSAGPNKSSRIAWLALVLALAGGLSGLTEATTLDSVEVKSVFEDGSANWLLIILWALTGAWYGLMVGWRPPAKILTRALRESPSDKVQDRRSAIAFESQPPDGPNQPT